MSTTSPGRADTLPVTAHNGWPYFHIYMEVVYVEEVLNIIETFIQNDGFPIACVVAMFWMWNREREEHKKEAEKWSAAINNNTRVMEKLVEKLEDAK